MVVSMWGIASIVVLKHDKNFTLTGTT
jgi:hypothetical protein